MRFSGKEKTPPEEVGRSLNASEGLACICASRGIGANKSIHQCAHWFMKPPPAASDMIRVPAGQRKTPPEEVGRSLNASEGLACICASRGIGANKSIHQCAHWFMKPPPAASDMIRVPAGQRKTPPDGGVFLWCSSGDSNPGHPA